MKTRMLPMMLSIFFGFFPGNAQEFKSWSSQNGSSVEAKYVGLKRERLYLESKEGERMNLPVGALAEADREYAVAQAVKAGHLAAPRTWTSQSGTTVVASYSHVENNQLTLLKGDGTSLTLPLSVLDEADRNEVVKLAIAAGEMPDSGTGAIQESVLPDQLATFADGKWKGLYAVYQSPYFRVRVEPDSTVFIDMLVDGEQVGTSLRNAFGASYRDESKPTTEWSTRRKLLRVEGNPKPAVYQGETKLILKGFFEDEVAYSLTLFMKPNELRLSFEVNDPPKVEYKTHSGFSMVFPESYKPELGVKFEETQAILKNWSLKIYRPDVPSKTIAYWESIEPGKAVEKLELIGPWGNRKLTVEAPPVEINKKPIYKITGIYPGKPVYSGFNIQSAYSGDEVESEYILKFE
ncbi:MAG: hypothetical protein WD708_00315 [Kiritimatiellia bacterium]